MLQMMGQTRKQRVDDGSLQPASYGAATADTLGWMLKNHGPTKDRGDGPMSRFTCVYCSYSFQTNDRVKWPMSGRLEKRMH